MAQPTNFITATAIILLQFIHLTFTFPTLTGTKREAMPALPSVRPDVAAHYVQIVPRTYAYVRAPPKVLAPSYYNRFPRIFVRIPRGYYPTPKSELFRMNDFNNGYLNNLLPIFNKETPNVKIDPVDPGVSVPITGDGIGGVTGDNPGNPGSPFPFWNTQVGSWVWPDGDVTGALPQVNVRRPQSTLFQAQLQSKDPNKTQLQDQAQPVLDAGPITDTVMSNGP